MKLETKTFHQLTNLELYGILRLRGEVFVVEQNCPYLDVEGTDIVATHLFYKEGEEEGDNILAYCRLFWDKELDNTVTMGRVVTSLKHKTRKTGMGLTLIREAVAFTKEIYRPQRMLIHAQEVAIPFYEKVGFSVCSEMFLEDDIPHKMMEILWG